MPRNESAKVERDQPIDQWRQQLPVRYRRRALGILLRAAADAAEAGRSRHEFAVELVDLHRFGVLTNDLRWLVSMGYVDHYSSHRTDKQARASPSLSSGLEFIISSRFVLTDSGVSLALQRCTRQQLSHQRNATIQSALKVCEPARPLWNAELRELWFGSSLVKRFRTKADNQIAILSAFQEDGWPPRIDDPIPPNGSAEAKRKLHDAINKLNHHQIEPLIHFTGDGTGKGVCWTTDADATYLRHCRDGCKVTFSAHTPST